jgi:hypothetical protein
LVLDTIYDKEREFLELDFGGGNIGIEGLDGEEHKDKEKGRLHTV